MPDEDERKSSDERNAVAKDEVRDLHPPQSSAVELVVECEINVDGHCQSPESIALHEAVIAAGVSSFLSLHKDR